MSSLYTPMPPLRSLSTNATKRVEVTDHVLPDFVEVLKERLDGNSRSDGDTYWVYDAFMWTRGHS